VGWEPGKKFAWNEPAALNEWTLESRGGKTILRLVQSGFFTGADWEKEWFDSTSYGWGFMLLSLQWALERHRGEPRDVAWPRVKTALSREAAYQKVISAGALFTEYLNSVLREGKEYSLSTTNGDRFTERVEFVCEQRGFCLSVREMKDALLWLTIEGSSENIEV
jgi:hypothetical protein